MHSLLSALSSTLRQHSICSHVESCSPVWHLQASPKKPYSSGVRPQKEKCHKEASKRSPRYKGVGDQHCEHTNCHGIAHLKMANFMFCEF